MWNDKRTELLALLFNFFFTGIPRIPQRRHESCRSQRRSGTAGSHIRSETAAEPVP
jgi:hypothetical protein